MAKVGAFATTRTTLTAGTTTEIVAPRESSSVLIGNATPDDLKVYTTKDDEATYFKVASGWESPIDLKSTRFLSGAVAFWVVATQDGDVVIKWL